MKRLSLRLLSLRLLSLLTLVALLAGLCWHPAAAIYITTPPILDGVISAGEYGDAAHQWSDGARTWYMAWDSNYLYVAVDANGNASADEMVLYIDTDPQTPVNGGGDSNGTNVGVNFDDAAYSVLPFRADHYFYIRNDYTQFNSDNGANGWGTWTDNPAILIKTTSGNVQETWIPWGLMGGRPIAFNIFFYLNGGNPYGGVSGNPGSATGNVGRLYFAVENTSDTTGDGTTPFERYSFVNPSSSYSLNGGSFYYLTANSSDVLTLTGDLSADTVYIGAGSTLQPSGVRTLTLSGQVTVNGVLKPNNGVGNDLNVIADDVVVVSGSAPIEDISFYNISLTSGSTFSADYASLQYGTLSMPATSMVIFGTMTVADKTGNTYTLSQGTTDSYFYVGDLIIATQAVLQAKSDEGHAVNIGVQRNMLCLNPTPGQTFTNGTGWLDFTYLLDTDGSVNCPISFSNVRVLKDSGYTLSLAGDMTGTGTLSIDSGMMDANGHAITMDALTMAAGAELRLPSSLYPTVNTSTLNLTSRVSYLGATNTISTAPTYGFLTIGDGVSATVAGLDGAGTLQAANAVTVSSGSTLNMPNGAAEFKRDLTITNAVVEATGGTLTFSGSYPQFITGPATLTASNLVVVNTEADPDQPLRTPRGTTPGDIGVISNVPLTLQKIDVQQGRLTLNGISDVAGPVVINAAGSLWVKNTLSVAGSFTNNGRLFSNSEIILNHTGGQALDGTPLVDNWYSLTLNAGNPVTAAHDMTVSGTLTLNSNLTMNGGTILKLGDTASVAGSSDVIGLAQHENLAQGTTYWFNNHDTRLTFDNATPPSTVTINLVPGQPTGFPYAAKRTYEINVAGGTGNSATLRLGYQDGEPTYVNGSDESRMRLYRYNGSAWDVVSSTVDTTNNYVEGAGITTFSNWTAAPNTPTLLEGVTVSTSAGNTGWLAGLALAGLAAAGLFLLRRKA